MEAVRIELKQAVRQHNKLFMRLAAFLYFEHLLIDDLAQPYFNGVILNRKKVLHKLFEDLFKRKLVDLAVRDQPSDLLPGVFENTFPIYHVLEFILHLI